MGQEVSANNETNVETNLLYFYKYISKLYIQIH